MNEIITRQIKLPLSIHGFTVKDSNDDYNVYLNKDIAEEGKRKTYDHEIKHIAYGHFYRSVPVSVMEDEVKYGKR